MTLQRRKIQVFEHQRIYYGKDGFQKEEWEALARFHDNNPPAELYYSLLHKGIKFSSYVGVIQVGNLTVEILPKADKFDSTEAEEKDKKKWHKILFGMLQACNKIRLHSISHADLHLREYTLLDLYIAEFLDQVSMILRKGLTKRYRRTTGNLPSLKGQLQFQQQIQKNLIHKERFYTQYQTYDQQHLINQILLKALRVLLRITNTPDFIDKINNLILRFPDITDISVYESTFSKIRFNRKNEHYREAITIAKLILLNYAPDIKNGQENVLAILFNMNDLFEEYVLLQFQKCETENISVYGQSSKAYWKAKNHQSRTLRPDIVIEFKKEKYTLVLDTKWKVLDNIKPSREDLHQLFAYSQFWKSERVFLLYPDAGFELGHTIGEYKLEKEYNPTCEIAFLKFWDEEKERLGRLKVKLKNSKELDIYSFMNHITHNLPNI